jgi:hypothetical protein
MAAAPLVEKDIEAGLELVRLLDERGFPVTGAVWIYFPDIEEWKLVIRTPKAATDLTNAFLELAKAMDSAKPGFRSQFDLARVKLVPPADRMLAAMGSAVRAEGLNQIRFSSNVINGIFIDDALIYRLAA